MEIALFGVEKNLTENIMWKKFEEKKKQGEKFCDKKNEKKK